jgi:hypothetical protein
MAIRGSESAGSCNACVYRLDADQPISVVQIALYSHVCIACVVYQWTGDSEILICLSVTFPLIADRISWHRL